MLEPGGPDETRDPEKNSGRTQRRLVQRPQRDGQLKLWEAGLTGPDNLQPTVRIDRSPDAQNPGPTQLPTRVFTLAQQTKFTPSDYIIDRLIGEGGMGWVYHARQRALNRDVAVKAIRSDIANQEDARRQFAAEALFIGALDHPNIVPIHELGSNEEGQLFYAMKLVDGTPWSQVIRQKTLERNLEILLRVADAIAFAHSRDVLHCDLKPDNIMLGGFGEVYVMDWGLALSIPFINSLGPDQKEFFPGGTPPYMPPEFAHGLADKIGPASDLYLLGGILYEILTGRVPHPETRDVGLKNYLNEVTRPTEDHAGLTDIAMRALAPDPKDRHADVKQFQKDIRTYLQHMDSLFLTEAADQLLADARQAVGYGEFNRALSAYEQSLNLWKENDKARQGLENSRLEYARRALTHADLDLAESLLNPKNPLHRPLLIETGRRQKERDRRQASLHRLRISLIILGVVTLAILLIGQSWIRSQRNEARYESFINATRLAVQELYSGDWKEVRELENNLQGASTGWEWEWLDRNSRPAFSGPGKTIVPPRIARVSPDGKTNAWLNQDGRFEFWTGGKTWSWQAGPGIRDFRLLEDASGSPTLLVWQDLEILSFNANDGTLLQKIALPATDQGSLKGCFSANGKRLLQINGAGEASIVDARDGNISTQLNLPGASQAVTGDLSPDGNKAALFLDDQSIAIFDTKNGSLLRRTGIQKSRASLFHLEYVNGGRMLLVGNVDRGVALFDATTLIPRLSLPLPENPTAFAVSPDGHYLAAGTAGGSLLVQDILTGDVIWRTHLIGQPITFVSFRENPELLQIVDGKNLLLELPLAERLPYSVLSRYDYPIAFFVEDRAASILYGVRNNGALSRISLQPGTLPGKNLVQGLIPGSSISATGSGPVFRLFLSKETGIEMLSSTGKISLWKTLPPVRLLAADAAGKILAASRQNHLLLFSLNDASDLGQWDLPSDITTIEWLGEKNLLAVGCADGSLRVLDPKTGQYPVQLKFEDPILTLASNPNGQELVVSSQNRDVTVWDIQSKKLKQQLHSHEHIVLDMAYSPKKDRLFTASADGRVHIFDTKTWREIISFQAHRGTVIQLLLAADGSTLITSGADGDVRLWAGSRTPAGWP